MLAADAGVATASACHGEMTVGQNAVASEVAPTVAQSAPATIVFVDSAVSDLAELAATSGDAELVLIDAERDGIDQITNHLATRQNVQSIQVVSHGASGRIQLGNTNVDTNTLNERADQIRKWRGALSRDADLLIYGCDVAADQSGQDFVRQLARLAGADVGASSDRTANAQQHGDWDLEFCSGVIESALAISPEAIEAFRGHLAIQIRAAGTTGEEQMQLLIDGVSVQTWNVTGTGAYAGQYDTYTYNQDGIDVDRIRVAFTNDLYLPEQNFDRNLRVDWIRVDGVQYETESADVFSTGTWISGVGIQPGNWQSEFLHTDGYFQYTDNSGGTNGGSVSLTSSSASVDEDAGSITLTLQRSGGSDGSAEVFFRTNAGSANAGSDFTAQNSSVVFADGQTSASITIQISDDATDESDESFQVELTSANGADLGGTMVTTITINDDDVTAPPQPSGLIGYWALNETSAGTIVDSSGTGNDGQAINFASPNGPTNDTPDVNGFNPGSFSFDGNNDFINVGPDESLRLTEGTYTQTVWIKPTDTSNNYQGVIGYQAGGVNSRYPFIYTRNDMIYAGFGAGATWKGVVADNALDIGQWNHVAVTFDGTTMVLMVDGEVVGTNNNFGGSLPTTATSQLSIGKINTYFAGQLDEVRLYDRALSQNEVVTVMNAADPPPPPTSSPGQIGLAATQVAVNENEGTVSIGLLRTGGASGPAEVYYTTQDASGEAGVDYFGTSDGRVQFADGQVFASINIPIIDNFEQDGEKTFQVSLFRVDGASQGEPRTATVTIVDDESGSGLIGYWNLNETDASGPIVDSSGQGNNGQAVGFNSPFGPTNIAPDTNSPNPGAFSFDGSNDAIEIAENESLRLTEGKYSQSVWVRPTANDGKFHGVLGYQSGGVNSRYPFIYTLNNSVYAGFGAGATWKGVTANGVISVGSWNHIAVSFDGSRMVLYVNGEVVGTNDDFGGSLPTTATAQLSIGRVNNQFVGQIDEVRMWDRAINGGEVQALIDGATLPPPNVVGYFTTEALASGFVQPTTVERLPDGRFLVAERAGVIKVVNQDGSVNATPLLDINDVVNRVGVDRGVMSIAIPPDFAQTRQLYVAYTYDPPEVQGRSGDGGPDGEGARVARVSRFTVNESWTVADRNSEVVVVGKNSLYEYIGQPNRRPLLSDPQSGLDENGNYIRDFIASDELSHTVGDMEFASDGSLIISVGDGGSYGRVDPVNLRSLDLNSLNGKILRVDRWTGLGLSDNPFYDGDPGSNQSRVYSYGLRNPFRFAINPNDGEIFIADVGWLNWEEINTGRGKNFGWPAYEGFGLTGGSRGSYASLPEVQDYLATNPEITPPIWTRSHSAGARAIIMGDFIQGGDYPASLQGAFLFTDIGDRVLRAGRLDSNGQLIDVVPVSSSVGFITDVMRMSDGSLYYVDFASGTLGKLVFNS